MARKVGRVLRQAGRIGWKKRSIWSHREQGRQRERCNVRGDNAEGSGPGMEHAKKPDLCSQMLRITGKCGS
jgi:hypothetical protein